MSWQRRFSPRAIILIAATLVIPSVIGSFAQAPQSSPNGVYVAALRTPAHVSRSSAEVFHQVVDGVLDQLKSKHVPLAVDPSRPMIQSEEAMPVATLLNAAKDSGAASLLVLTVDRPATSWLKLSVQAYDMSGMPLWEEHASYGGGLNGGKAVQEVTGKISKQLAPRFGKPGLPVAP